MHTVTKFEGIMDLILAEAVRQGLAKTKSEALRLGIIELNSKYDLLESAREEKEDIDYIRKAREKIASGRLKLHTEEELRRALKS